MHSCTNCNKQTKIVTDWSSGDKICTECGVVLKERVISEDTAEYRIFSEDDAGKVRAGEAKSIFESNVSCEIKQQTDEKGFYVHGLELMENFFAAHFADARRKAVEHRAREIFDFVFRKQQKEKQLSDLHATRLKYSRKIPFLVTAIWIAFMEKGESHNKWSIQHISTFFKKNITGAQIKNCMSMINMNMDKLRRKSNHLAKARRHRNKLRKQRFSGSQ